MTRRVLVRLRGVVAALAAAVAAAMGVAALVALAAGEVGPVDLARVAVPAAVAGVAARGLRAGDLLGGYATLAYAVLFAPLVVVVVYAFNEGRSVTVWDGFSTRWFSRALEDESIRTAIVRSLEVAVASSVLSTVLGTAAAVGIARARLRARLPLDVVAFLALVVPELVLGIAALLFFVNAGFELGVLTMVLAHAVFGSSLVLLIVRARLMSMGTRLEDAGRDLGASPAAAFRQITLPRLAPAIAAAGLLAFVLSFDNVVLSNLTAGAGNDTWPLRVLASLRFGLRPDLNAAAAMLLAVTVLAVIVAAAVLRRSARRAGGAGPRHDPAEAGA